MANSVRHLEDLPAEHGVEGFIHVAGASVPIRSWDLDSSRSEGSPSLIVLPTAPLPPAARRGPVGIELICPDGARVEVTGTIGEDLSFGTPATVRVYMPFVRR